LGYVATIDWEARIYDDMVSLLATPSVPTQTLDELAAAIRLDLHRRRMATEFPYTDTYDHAPKPQSVIGARLKVFLVSATVLIALGSMGKAPMTSISAAVIITVLLVREARRSSTPGWKTPTPGVCPRCTYDLHGHDEAIPESLIGKRIGPDRCPECGQRWPLIPGGVESSQSPHVARTGKGAR
jgi:hypothetical protein